MTDVRAGRRADRISPARPVTPAGIVAARLSALVERLDGSSDLGSDPSFGAELREVAELAGGLEAFVDRCTSPESPALAELAAATRAYPWAGALEQEMLSGHAEGAFLGVLVRATRARQVLEIGMFTGYSALAMAEALPFAGRVVACEVDGEVAAFARSAFAATPAGERIDVRVGPAAATLTQLAAAGEVFDLIFIDADKAGYLDYVDAVLDHGLLAPHGLLCIDNTLMQGQPWASPAAGRTTNGEAIAAFDSWLAADQRVQQVIVPLRDGITLAVRT